jgi:DNA gyrase/topoisomerase IV subunit B
MECGGNVIPWISRDIAEILMFFYTRVFTIVVYNTVINARPPLYRPRV